MRTTSRGRSVAYLLGLLTCLLAVAAMPSADELFRARGLIKVGFRLLLPAEAEVHAAAKSVHAAKGKLAAEAAAGRDLDAKLKRARQNQQRLDTQMADVGNRLAAHPNDNHLIGQTNALLAQIRSQVAAIDDLTARQSRVASSQSAYITAALDAAATADADAHAYDPLPHDAELAAAMARYNLTAVPKVKLGPSPGFAEDLAFIAQCKKDVTSGSVPITFDDGVPHVEVLLDGRVKRTMIWDSGASIVSLTARTAHELGRDPGPDAPVVKATLADGRQVSEHLITVDAIRVGPFTATHVQCTVLPPEIKEADELLGGSFQRHFQCKLDSTRGALHLTPLDPTAGATAGRRSPPSPAALGLPRWVVLFRSDDPSIWNQSHGRPSDRNGFAAVVDTAAPDETHYLRIRRTSGSGGATDAAIIPIEKADLTEKTSTWCGSDWYGFRGFHLGVKNPAWNRLEKGLTDIDGHCQGWGFGNTMWDYDRGQGYDWGGQKVDRCVMEIAVTAGELTEAERRQLVVGER